MFTVLRQKQRLPVIEYPLAVVAVYWIPHSHGENLHWESYVFLLANDRIEKTAEHSNRRVWQYSGASETIRQDLELSAMDGAVAFAERTIEAWQREEYGKLQALHLLQPANLVEDNNILTRLSMWGIFDDSLTLLRKTRDRQLKTEVDRLLQLPQVQ